MDWFKHDTTSMDDPDIQEAEDTFGDAGYNVFFKTLEIFGKEYSHLENDKLRISSTVLARKCRKRWTKVEKILNFYQTKNRIFHETDGAYVLLEIPDFVEKASNWTRRKRPGKDPLPTEAPTEAPTAIEEEEEVEVEKETIGHFNQPWNDFWEIWPKKVAKEAARKAWKKLSAKDRVAAIKDVEQRRDCEEWAKNNYQFCLNPATYLNGKRWNDEETKPKPTGPAPDAAAAIRAQEAQEMAENPEEFEHINIDGMFDGILKGVG